MKIVFAVLFLAACRTTPAGQAFVEIKETPSVQIVFEPSSETPKLMWTRPLEKMDGPVYHVVVLKSARTHHNYPNFQSREIEETTHVKDLDHPQP